MGRKKKFKAKKLNYKTATREEILEEQARIEDHIQSKKKPKEMVKLLCPLYCPSKDKSCLDKDVCEVYLNMDLDRHPEEWYKAVIAKHVMKKHSNGKGILGAVDSTTAIFGSGNTT